MRKTIGFALLVACSFASAPQAKEPTIRVFILAGQSNMAGSGVGSELPEELVAASAQVSIWRGKGWTAFKPGSRFGPEVAFARDIAQQFPGQRIGLVKYAVGGTSLLAWAPDWDKARADRTGNAGSGPLYKKLMAQAVPATAGENVEVLAVLWMQGERDARFPEVAAEYEQNLRTLIARLRSDLKRPQLPFIMGHINPPAKAYRGLGAVRAAQSKVATTDPHIVVVSTDGLAKHKDNLHYNTAGQLELGARLAKAFAALSAEGKKSGGK